MVTMKTRITISGPIFQKPPRGLRDGVQKIVQRVVEAGEQRLDVMLRPRPRGVYLSASQAGRGKASTGHYRRNLHASVTNLNGRIDDGGVVYGPWLEGTGRRNSTTRFKGYRSFRQTSQYLVKNFQRIAGPAIRRLIERLG